MLNIFSFPVVPREFVVFPFCCECSSGERLWQPEGAFGSEQLQHESGAEQRWRHRPVR